MPILRRDPLLRDPQVATPQSTFAEVMGATFDEAMTSGLFGIAFREEALDAAQGESGSERMMRLRYGVRSERKLSPVLTPDDARTKLRDAGLSESLSVPESGIRSDALDILIQRKRVELRRQSILRSYDGIGAPLIGSVLGSFVDPSNIALAFVPVVGQARYAAWLKSASGIVGRTGVRVGVGAVEGVAGLAPVEVANYYSRQREQADYSAYDLMVGIAGGAAFGAALHGGAGLFPEAMGRYRVSPPPRPTLTERLADAEPPVRAGEPAPPREVAAPVPIVDAAARERLMVLERLAEGRPVTPRQAEAAVKALDQPEFRARVEAELAAEAANVAPPRLVAEARTVLERVDRELLAVNARREALSPKLNKLPGKTKRSVEYDALTQRKAALELAKVDAEATIARNKAAADAQAKLAALRRDGTIPPEFKARADEDVAFVESLSSATRRALETDPFAGVRPFIATRDPATQAAAFRMAAAQVANGEPVNVLPAFLADSRSMDPAAALASARSTAGKADGADEAASEWADSIEPLPDDVETARTMVRDDEQALNDLMKNAGREISDDEAEALRELMTQARSDAQAAKAAAMCLMRTGG